MLGSIEDAVGVNNLGSDQRPSSAPRRRAVRETKGKAARSPLTWQDRLFQAEWEATVYDLVVKQGQDSEVKAHRLASRGMRSKASGVARRRKHRSLPPMASPMELMAAARHRANPALKKSAAKRTRKTWVGSRRLSPQ